MSFPKYPEYKDSGNPRLGKIPCHWQAMPFKWVIKSNDGGVWGNDPTGNNDAIVLRSTEQTVDGHWCIKDPAFRSLTNLEKYSSRLKTGDLLVTKSSGSSKHIGKTTLVDSEVAEMQCCFGNFMQRIRTTDSLKPRLAWYFMNNDVARQQLDFLSSSTTGLANLNGTLIGEILLSVPPEDEQAAICEFLDHETAKIDALIEEQQRLIELLKEERQAVISRAVTKGLDPDVPMKDSGVEFLGNVPNHWQVLPLKFLTPSDRPIMYGIVLPGPDFPGGVPIVKGGDVKPDRLKRDLLSRTDPNIEMKYVRSRLLPGDIVYSIRGGIGDVELVPEELHSANITQDAARISAVKEVDRHWLLMVMKSKAIFAQLEAGATGATIRGINIFDLKRARIPVPPIDEQADISKYLGREISIIKNLIQISQKAIQHLNERRSALISAAVTGKIDVRNWQSESHAADGLPMAAEEPATYEARES